MNSDYYKKLVLSNERKIKILRKKLILILLILLVWFLFGYLYGTHLTKYLFYGTSSWTFPFPKHHSPLLATLLNIQPRNDLLSVFHKMIFGPICAFIVYLFAGIAWILYGCHELIVWLIRFFGGLPKIIYPFIF